MNAKAIGLSRRYVSALRWHLDRKSRAGLQVAEGLGRHAVAIGLRESDLARIHQRALTALETQGRSSGIGDGKVARAGSFLIEALTPIERTHRTMREANGHLKQVTETLRQRTVELADAIRRLKDQVVRRKSAEESLRSKERQHKLLLEQSHLMQEQLRHLSREILMAQEEERKHVSRALHDEISQTLTGINIRLMALRKEATVNTRGLTGKIAGTQRLVEKSVNIVHRFARDLRPALLDDIGIVPALTSCVKDFAKRTGIPVRLTAFAGVDRLSSIKRTVLYRVAQEALTNVARHAQASLVKVSILRLRSTIRMQVKDNGKSFQVQRVFSARTRKHLGLIGMRERVEMVGGNLAVESAPGKGTTIRVQIPLGNCNGA